MTIREDWGMYNKFCEKLREATDLANRSFASQHYNPELYAEFKSAVSALTNAADRMNAAMLNAKCEAEERGMRFLTAIITWYDLRIDQEIQRFINEHKFACHRYEARLNELTRIGYDYYEAKKIITDIKEPDTDRFNKILAIYQEERRQINQFRNSHPFYNMALLNNTRFEGWSVEGNEFYNPITNQNAHDFRCNNLKFGDKPIVYSREMSTDYFGLIAKALGETRKIETVSGSRYFCESLFWASQPKQAAKT